MARLPGQLVAEGVSYQVKILLDTGASTSVFGVKPYLDDHPEALHGGEDSVTGVGGKQAIHSGHGRNRRVIRAAIFGVLVVSIRARRKVSLSYTRADCRCSVW